MTVEVDKCVMEFFEGEQLYDESELTGVGQEETFVEGYGV